MIQQGQVFKLKSKGPDGQPLWAYRYRLEGRGSERPQVGGFATRAEAEKALRKVIDRLGPGGGRATITLAEFVDEYLEMHQAAPVTIAKLRWLLSKATAVLDRLPASDNPILFPNMRGGRIDVRIFGRKHWRPAQSRAGIEPVRGLYDLRHTYATFALRAGVPVFAVSRFMGTSIAMIDRHYGHLANDSREHAVALLDALALERAVDAAWTSTPAPRKPIRKAVSGTRSHRLRRSVDARWTPRLVSVASADD